MTFTYDVNADVGKVRLLIGDSSPDEHLFTDEELTALIAMASDSPLLGAAMALERVASDQAMTARAVRILDLQVEGGASVAGVLMKRAETLRSRYQQEADVLIDVGEMILNPTAYQQLILKRVGGL